MIYIETYLASIGRIYNRLRHFVNAQNVVFVRFWKVFTILLFLLFSLLYLPILLRCFCIVYNGNNWCYLCNSIRLKHIESSCYFFEVNCRGLNLNFLKLKQLLIDGQLFALTLWNHCKKMEFEVNNDTNSKVSLCQGDITKLNIDAILVLANKALIVGEVIDGAIHEAPRPGLLGKY